LCALCDWVFLSVHRAVDECDTALLYRQPPCAQTEKPNHIKRKAKKTDSTTKHCKIEKRNIKPNHVVFQYLGHLSRRLICCSLEMTSTVMVNGASA
ncbi:MAG: hypothetical protein AAFR02_05395, partial [Pseudomonadota bacterium]